ncbi:alpha/beta fold hydrolase [Nocardioides marmorisolisilvae]|uniref:Alpha/beta fold hydrolase n=1 Tax=Nocardioides marmorisolisilvae TaxID=1542737 RepID=A0A3N0E0F5_9ACTN|nr:alpha/beta fold hydrolase [Nocardioides marmorisolisilvae]RNL81337.1 alpha/beta fold hydrolase [Nocardioides marmorisolisilvae]
MTTSFVTTTDGLRLAVHEFGRPDAPTIVAVHGFPDSHHVWDGIAAELGDRFRVIAYDVRGAGESDKPRGRKAYHQDQLTADLLAVLDAVSPSEPVHLLAHDWGSMQSWDAVSTPDLAPRFASFTSISGPSLAYASRWLRGRGHLGASVRQVLTSTYMAVFQLPVLPELAARAGVIRRGAEKVGGYDPHRGLAETSNGVNIYRANVLRQLFSDEPRRTLVPTLVLVPREDAFSSPPVASNAPVGWVDDLTVREVDGGHWVVVRDPATIAAEVAAFVEAHLPVAGKRKARR